MKRTISLSILAVLVLSLVVSFSLRRRRQQRTDTVASAHYGRPHAFDRTDR